MVAELKGDRYAFELLAKTGVSWLLPTARSTTENRHFDRGDSEQIAGRAGEKSNRCPGNRQKAFLENKSSWPRAEAKAAAEKALADLNSEIKKATDEYRTAEQAAQKSLADAKAAVDQALRAKVPSEPAAASKVDAQSQTAVEKAIEEAAAKALAQRQLKPRFDQITSEEPKKKAEEKIAAATKTQGDADKEFKKAELAKSTAENELQLAKIAETQAAEALTAAKSAPGRRRFSRKPTGR